MNPHIPAITRMMVFCAGASPPVPGQGVLGVLGPELSGNPALTVSRDLRGQSSGVAMTSTKTPGFITSAGRLVIGPTTEPSTGSVDVSAASTMVRACSRELAQAMKCCRLVADLTVP